MIVCVVYACRGWQNNLAINTGKEAVALILLKRCPHLAPEIKYFTLL